MQKSDNRDDWMNSDTFVPTYDKKKKVSDRNANKCIIEAPGQSSRELNPYWKDGGAGLPVHSRESRNTSNFGDRGLDWYERALKRAEETAKEEGRSLADVVAERWGSLEELTLLISQAKSKNSRRPGFRRPGDEYGREATGREREGRWRRDRRRSRSRDRRRSRSRERRRSRSRERKRSPKECKEEIIASEPAKILTEQELNALAAKLVKAEIMGKTSEIDRLKKELEEARAARERAPSHENTVILMEDSAGLTRPLKRPELEPRQGRRQKNKKTETHNDDGQRVRYFPDDDKHDLRSMFEREKLSSAAEDKELFIKMAGKRGKRGGDVEEEEFMDAARIEQSEGRKAHKDYDRAVGESLRRHRTLENCHWCLDSGRQAKHLVVAVGKTCYLSVPPEEPLTVNHCLIVPIQHYISGVSLDEDVWEEIHQFRKAIINLASSLDEDVIFFEMARTLDKHPHMVLNCVLLEKEAGEMAPIYFKKALLECEAEWSNNKKVVDIKGRDIRGSVPKGLPYFAVEFPQQGGFAHVIEDEKLFPANFAHSIIGGMLDLDHRTWRKSLKSSLSSQRERTLVFSRKFAQFDFTEKKKKKSNSSGSSSSSDSD